MIEAAVQAFIETFGAQPTAGGIGPGRVELLGNHTDYNGGRVLTAAIDRYVLVAGRARPGTVARVRSVEMGGTVEFDVRATTRDPEAHWGNYVQGVVGGLRSAGVEVPAFDAVITGDLPVASGLGSSAALETALAQFIGCLVPIELSTTDLALLLQKAENEFVGVACGILDQFSSLHGQAGQAIFLDCARLEHELLPLGEKPPAIVLCDPQIPRSLTDSPYNLRREECEQAAASLGELLHRPVGHLCDVSADEFEAVAAALPDPFARRARHVIGENDRVLAARQALRDGRLDELGRLMGESHHSSRVHFENSTAELDLLCRIAAEQPGCLGARLCGAGWGGNTVNLVEPGAVDAFRDATIEAFSDATGQAPVVRVCHAANGAQAIALPC